MLRVQGNITMTYWVTKSTTWINLFIISLLYLLYFGPKWHVTVNTVTLCEWLWGLYYINSLCCVFNLLAISASVNFCPDWHCVEMLYWYVYLQNWEMGASICAAAPLLEFSFWTWVGGTGLCDWPVARYMACTHRMRSCSSSLAKITVSPSFTALKKARPPSRPVHIEIKKVNFK